MMKNLMLFDNHNDLSIRWGNVAQAYMLEDAVLSDPLVYQDKDLDKVLGIARIMYPRATWAITDNV